MSIYFAILLLPFSNLQTAMTLSMRGLEHLGRLSYKLPGARHVFKR